MARADDLIAHAGLYVGTADRDREGRHTALQAEAVLTARSQVHRCGRRIHAQRPRRRGWPADKRAATREGEQIDSQGFDRRAPIERDAGAIPPEHLPVGLAQLEAIAEEHGVALLERCADAVADHLRAVTVQPDQMGQRVDRRGLCRLGLGRLGDGTRREREGHGHSQRTNEDQHVHGFLSASTVASNGPAGGPVSRTRHLQERTGRDNRTLNA